MQIETLNVYCDVVRLKSFSKGAKKNNITQPMASQSIQLLEKHFGVKLIDRSKRPWTVTDEGTVFYEKCRHILEKYYALEREIKKHHEKIESHVRIASIYSAGLRHMKAYVQEFMLRYPSSQIHLEYHNPQKVYEDVLTEKADIGIISFPNRRRELDIIPWRNEKMVVITPAQFNLLGTEIELKDINNEKFIHFDKTLKIRKEIDRFLRDRGVDVNVVLEFDNIESIKMAVEIGSGIAILPKPTCDKEISSGTLKFYEIKNENFERPLCIISRKGRFINQTVEKFIRFMQSEQLNI